MKIVHILVCHSPITAPHRPMIYLIKDSHITCALHIFHCTLCIAHCALYIVHCTCIDTIFGTSNLKPRPSKFDAVIFYLICSSNQCNNAAVNTSSTGDWLCTDCNDKFVHMCLFSSRALMGL